MFEWDSDCDVNNDDVNILGGSIHTMRKNAEASKEKGLEVNAEKTKYMVISRDQMRGKMGTSR
jgi:hypothetical protein